jgi:hypothetical protein
MDLAEPLGRGVLFGGRGLLLYATTLVVAMLLFVLRLKRYKREEACVKEHLEEPMQAFVEEVDSDPDFEAARSEVLEEAPIAEADEVAEVAEAPARPLARFAVYDFDETLTRATYPQAYDGTPFGCMALNIPWDDPRAGHKRHDGSPHKEFGGFDDARIAQLQQHLAAMRDQGWTPAVLSYNLQWDKGEFCLKKLLDHYGLLHYFTHQGQPLVFGLKDMRRVGVSSKGQFIAELVRRPAAVCGLDLQTAPNGSHLLVDDDEVNIAGARAQGILGYQVAKHYEWDGLVGGLGRVDPMDFAKLENIAEEPQACAATPRRPRRNRRRPNDKPKVRPEARWKK